jgi:hypothetical protein
MKIEVLYFQGCPNHLPAMQMLREILDSLGREDKIYEMEVGSQAEAEATRFVGSPSIRVNGSDIEPWARTAKDFGLSCRTYVNGSHHGGVPFLELLRGAIVAQSWRAFVKAVERGAPAAAILAALSALACCLPGWTRGRSRAGKHRCLHRSATSVAARGCRLTACLGVLADLSPRQAVQHPAQSPQRGAVLGRSSCSGPCHHIPSTHR